MIECLEAPTQRMDPPSRQAIQEAKQRQMEAIKALRKLLTELRPEKHTPA